MTGTETLNFDPSLGAARGTTQRASLGYWLCQCGGWGAMAMVNVSFSLLNRPEVRDPLVLISIWGGLCGIMLSHQWRRYLRKHRVFVQPQAVPLGRIVLGLLVLTAAQVSLVACAFLLWPQRPELGSYAWLQAAAFWSFMFGCWTAFYGGLMAVRRAKRAEIEKLYVQIQAKDAELRALQAQVNPHFFFNSLNSIRALMYQDVPAAAHVVDRLAEMMRYTLQMGPVETATLEREMGAVRSYLAVEKIRFEERMTVVEELPTDLLGMAVPTLAIQTLVENAVKYGVETSVRGCEIRISAQRQADRQVTIVVANQGVLQSGPGATRIGLDNTAKRLALLFDGKASLTVAEQDGWVVATMLLPEEYR